MTLQPITKNGQEPEVCVKYAGPMELWNDALVTPCEGQSRRRLSHLRLSANTEMLRTACFLCVIGHRELLLWQRRQRPPRAPFGFLVCPCNVSWAMPWAMGQTAGRTPGLPPLGLLGHGFRPGHELRH